MLAGCCLAPLIFTFLRLGYSARCNTLKAILITPAAVSTVSSFLYSIYLTRGKLGPVVIIACVFSYSCSSPWACWGV